jgi:hypothetical protein
MLNHLDDVLQEGCKRHDLITTTMMTIGRILVATETILAAVTVIKGVLFWSLHSSPIKWQR